MRRTLTLQDTARRSPAEPAVSANDAAEISLKIDTDTASYGASQPAASVPEQSAGHAVTKRDAARQSMPEPAEPERRVSDVAIYDHPYVKRLEQDIEKIERRYERLEGKYEAQVRETQSIMIRANEQLIELQKASQVAQSKTLAEYLLRAKDFILGSNGQSTIDSNIDASTVA